MLEIKLVVLPCVEEFQHGIRVVYLKPSRVPCMERSALKELEMLEGFNGWYVQALVIEVDTCQ